MEQKIIDLRSCNCAGLEQQLAKATELVRHMGSDWRAKELDQVSKNLHRLEYLLGLYEQDM
jgi:hypothetical protein